MEARHSAGDAAHAARRARRPRFAATPIVALALALVAGACGLGDRAELEEAITATPGRLEAAAVTGTLTVEQRFLEAPDVGSGIPGVASPGPAFSIPDDGITMDAASAAVDLRVGPMQASLVLDGHDQVGVLVDEEVLYGRRDGVPADDARPWVRLDLEQMREDSGEISPFEGNAELILVALHPVLLVDLAAGTLTGSIETIGTESSGGEQLTGYEVNVALSKAIGDTRRSRYPEDRREAIEQLIELLGVDGDVHPGEVWLDDRGDLRRFELRLRQRPLRGALFEAVATLDLDAPGSAGAAFDFPTPQEVLTVDSVLRFARTVARTDDEDDAQVPASIAATLGSIPTPDDVGTADETQPPATQTPATQPPSTQPPPPEPAA